MALKKRGNIKEQVSQVFSIQFYFEEKRTFLSLGIPCQYGLPESRKKSKCEEKIINF